MSPDRAVAVVAQPGDDARQAPRSAPVGGQGTRGAASVGGPEVEDDVVLVQYVGAWRPATVLWRYLEGQRPRVLVRFETEAGLVVRQLRWADELRPVGRLLMLPLVGAREGTGTRADDNIWLW